ncbi:aminotransferase class I/II-fold pyridoxal phosphate-dependent enzyme [Sporolactobacillus pectinivorans]|uniref:aminotransferase class I/II-fold pyridoxal phosphate-dependent enzyme n=1 Tax=Sporolactobacillus pectinivorans TaxID=1591408 RepID=UPI000C261FE1|nr:aminotransferase class I/II-fold pyridoxal phosphate-dependent enzyme [Sporolactobacillus pectinivorans]
MDQHSTPVFDGLLKYKADQHFSFHVPGHKDGLVFPEKATAIFRQLLSIDATEVAGLDELYHPAGILRDGEKLLSDYYGTRASYFLVNGSTAGNLIMVLAACRRGDAVFVARDSHKSIFNALKLAGVRPVFLSPAVDADTGLATGVDDSAWEAAIRRFPKPKALILTYPNYYGMAASAARTLIAKAHACGAAVLVDEAHGPHFRLGAPVPPSTLDMGADLVVHSAHKMLPAMTMGAFLHVNSNRVAKERVTSAREMMQTSSPSYPIMASLDLARYYLAHLSSGQLNEWITHRNQFVKGLQRLKKIKVMEAEPGQFLLDPFKITLELKTEETGFDFQKQLLAAGIYPEMADPHRVLFTLGLTGRIDYKTALGKIGACLFKFHQGRAYELKSSYVFPMWSTLECPYDELDRMERKKTDLDHAAGQIAAEHVIPYPPGIPIIVQGERITKVQIGAVKNWLTAGAAFQNESINQGKITIYRAGAL